MRTFLITVIVIGAMLCGQAASAAPSWQLVQTVEVVADNNVTPLDFAFFDQEAQGKVELSNIKNLWGACADMIFYVNTDNGEDRLYLNFGGGMVELRLLNKKTVLFSERVSNITSKTPLVITIQDGKLTAELGRRSRMVSGVESFTGNLTTQSVEAKVKAYQFVEL